MVASTDKKLIIFTHIQKTAGTTLGRLLKVKYGFWPLTNLVHLDRTLGLHYYHDDLPLERIQKLIQLPEKRKQKIAIIQGHMGFGIHKHFARPFQYITVLRDPVERTISHYHQICADENSPFNENVRRKPIEDFIIDHNINALTNYQVKLLAGVFRDIPGNMDPYDFYPSTEKTLALAKANLRQYYVFALTEQFDESVILLKRTLGWTNAFYIKSNVTKLRRSRKDLSDRAIRLIQDANKFDIQLYEYAAQELESLILQEGPGFCSELDHFRHVNNYINALFTVPIDKSFKIGRMLHKRIYLKRNPDRG